MFYQKLLIVICTFVALIAFAANSVLCRLAIGTGTIDPTSFTILRLVSGALVLWLLITATQFSSKTSNRSGSWLAALMLFIYASTFSFAYIQMDTGVGALVLFGSVQITVILASLRAGARLGILRYIGLIIAFTGLVYLLLPNRDSNSLNISITSFSLMVLSGIAWGSYTLIGRGSQNPLRDTAHNFIKSLPFAALLLFVFLYIPAALSWQGVMLSIASGAITSALGYAVWYLVLPNLSHLQSGIIQLSVPVIAALGGVIFLEEAFTFKLLTSLIVVLTGISLTLYKSKKFK